jgi:hypothetical protein
MGKERGGEGAYGFIMGGVLSRSLQGWSWCPEQGLVRRAVALQGWGQACAAPLFLDGCRWPEVARRTRRFVQSRLHAGVRRWGRCRNGQGRGSGYASGVLG